MKFMKTLLSIKRIFIFTIVILTGANVFGQLAISTALSPTQLVQNVLISGGVSIGNITSTGTTGATTSQFGYFTNGNTTNLGLTSGVVMATGYVNHIPGAASTNGGMSDQTGSGSDADLALLTSGSAGTNDACVLQFDFVPTANTVSFRYVFASEEYPDYVCSTFNDVFGFFLSGPGISGTFSNSAVNIALIPGTTLPVAINTVNGGSAGSNGTSTGCTSLAYSSDYVNNSSGTTIVFGGFTKVLTATYSVTPCKTYHIKLAIADVGDEVYDSGVFLEANSFNAGGVVIKPSYSNSSVGNNAIKGCSDGIFTFKTTSPVSSPMTINYIITGTATNGIDYATIPTSAIIPTGQDSVSVLIQPLANGSTGTVILGAIGSCDTIYDTIKIIPYNPMVPITSGATSICSGATATIGVTNSGGIGPYTYNWSNALGTGTSYNVSPTTTTTYVVTATDKCGQTASNSVIITVNNNVNLTVTPSNPTVCPGDTVSLTVSGAGNYTWAPATALSATTGATVIANPTTTQVYTVTGSANGCSGTGSVIVNVSNNLPVSVTPANPTVCPGDTVTLTASGNATSFTWSPNIALSSTTGTSVVVNPTSTQTYIVTGTKGGCSGMASAIVTVSNNLPVTVTPINPSICLNGSGVTLTAAGNATSYVWSPSAGLSDTTTASVTANPAATTIYTITGTKGGCSGSNSVTVNVISINATATSTNENCGQSNGTATATPSGNCNQNWTYAWNTTPVQQTTQTAIHLPAGPYTVTVYCGACTATATATVTNLPGPSVSIISATNTTCGSANGGAIANATLGNGPYTYKWSNGQIGANLTSVIAGTYIVTATDFNNCTATNSVTLTNIAGPTASITANITADCGMSDGSAILTVTGGTQPYTFNWNSIPPEASQNLINVPEGDYIGIVTDSNGCTFTVSTAIAQNPGPTVTASSTSEICGKGNGTATATASGGMGNYTYLWSNNATTAVVSGLATGTYTVSISDGGCSASTSIFVGEIPGPVAGFIIHPKLVSVLDNQVYFADNSTGSVIIWDWSLGDGYSEYVTNFTHNYINVGSYPVTLIVTDTNGCKDEITDTVKVKDVFTFYVPNAFSPNDDDLNDGFAPQGTNVDPDHFEMYIFDRWGNLMFHTTKWLVNSSEPWNGTLNNSGKFDKTVMDTYVYRIILKEIEGPTHEYIGRITIVQ